MSQAPCHCGQLTFRECCAPLLSRRASAATAEQLMRSRYTAFAIHDERYLLATWHDLSRPTSLSFAPDLTWTGLTVLSATADLSAGPPTATVEFEARYQQGLSQGAQREVSSFIRSDHGWLYVGPV